MKRRLITLVTVFVLAFGAGCEDTLKEELEVNTIMEIESTEDDENDVIKPKKHNSPN